MSREYNIKWRPGDEAELRRVVKNFNAKIARVAKKNPEMEKALPDRVSAKELRSMIKTRADFNRELNMLKRFSKKGAEKLVEAPDNDNNLVLTKWQRTEMNRMAAIINRKRADRRKKIFDAPAKSRGEELGYTVGQDQASMGKAEKVALSPVNAFTPSMDRYSLSVKFRKLKKEVKADYWNWRDEIMRNNYITSLEENFNINDIQEIVDRIRGMDFDEFRRVFAEERLSTFELNYPMDDIEYRKNLSSLRAIWTPNK